MSNTVSTNGSNLNTEVDTNATNATSSTSTSTNTTNINNLNPNPNPFKDTKGHHILNDSWVLWFHDMDDEDWG